LSFNSDNPETSAPWSFFIFTGEEGRYPWCLSGYAGGTVHWNPECGILATAHAKV